MPSLLIDKFEFRCRFFGVYVAYWTSPRGILDGNFEDMFEALTFFGLPWNEDVSWVIYKRRKFVGRSATYLGV